MPPLHLRFACRQLMRYLGDVGGHVATKLTGLMDEVDRQRGRGGGGCRAAAAAKGLAEVADLMRAVDELHARMECRDTRSFTAALAGKPRHLVVKLTRAVYGCDHEIRALRDVLRAVFDTPTCVIRRDRLVEWVPSILTVWNTVLRHATDIALDFSFARGEDAVLASMSVFDAELAAMEPTLFASWLAATPMSGPAPAAVGRLSQMLRGWRSRIGGPYGHLREFATAAAPNERFAPAKNMCASVEGASLDLACWRNWSMTLQGEPDGVLALAPTALGDALRLALRDAGLPEVCGEMPVETKAHTFNFSGVFDAKDVLQAAIYGWLGRGWSLLHVRDRGRVHDPSPTYAVSVYADARDVPFNFPLRSRARPTVDAPSTHVALLSPDVCRALAERAFREFGIALAVGRLIGENRGNAAVRWEAATRGDAVSASDLPLQRQALYDELELAALGLRPFAEGDAAAPVAYGVSSSVSADFSCDPSSWALVLGSESEIALDEQRDVFFLQRGHRRMFEIPPAGRDQLAIARGAIRVELRVTRTRGEMDGAPPPHAPATVGALELFVKICR